MSAGRAAVSMPSLASSTSAVEALTAGEEPVPETFRLLSRREAERLTEQIKFQIESIENGMFKLRNLLEHARGSNVWQILGFKSWQAYLVSLFDRPLRLTSDQRREVVGYLHGEGLSTRAIAPVVGVSQQAVSKVTTKLSPPEPAPSGAVEVAGRVEQTPEAPRPVAGLDGKTYTRPEPAPKPVTVTRPTLTARVEDALGFIDQTVYANEGNGPDVVWTTPEVLELLADIRRALTVGLSEDVPA
jgi:hypothetical protein